MSDNGMFAKLCARGSEFLNCRYPIICGAMTWVSEPQLVAAVCNNGGFGCLAGGNAPTAVLQEQIGQLRSLTANPFAVNLITIAPAYKEHLAMIKDNPVEYIVFAGSFPKEKEVEAAKATGAKVMCFASTLSIAERMIKFGADAIILEGSEAGGHIGHVSAMVLLQQVLFKVGDKIPVFVAGGIATGKMIAHVMMMGAASSPMHSVCTWNSFLSSLGMRLLKMPVSISRLSPLRVDAFCSSFTMRRSTMSLSTREKRVFSNLRSSMLMRATSNCPSIISTL